MTFDRNIWVVVGLLAAPLAPAIYFAVMTPITVNGQTQSGFGLISLFYPYALAASFLFGMPAYLLARRLGLAIWWSALTAGAAIGALFASRLHDLLMLCPLGAAAAFLFWIFARHAP